MRQSYLGETAKTLWSGQRSFDLYDAFFGKRIANKWSSALDLLNLRPESKFLKQWLLSQKEPVYVWDWGCGTSRASRTFLKSLDLDNELFLNKIRLAVSDHDPSVESMAKAILQHEFPSLNLIHHNQIKLGQSVILISHVLNELSSSQAIALSDVVSRSGWVFWVENGTKLTSRHLSSIRNKLRHTHDILAPCISQNSCSAIEGKPHSDWCHFFADLDSDYFTNPIWAEFSKELGVDLRSLPFSFFIAKNKSIEFQKLDADFFEESVIRLGRARVNKGFAKVLTCDFEARLGEIEYAKRSNPELFKQLKKDSCSVLMPKPVPSKAGK